MHCLITGAADGIGKALALRFARAGYTITGVDVDAVRAEQTVAAINAVGGRADFRLTDLSQPSNIAPLVADLAHRPPLDVCIHNAGSSAVGRFADLPVAQQTAVIHLNLLAPMLLTQGILQTKRLNQPSVLVFIASLSRFTGYPGAAVYGASKDGLASYARSLSVSLAGQQTHVLTVYPGPTRTAHARRYSPDNRNEQRRMPPETLADAIVKAVEARQRQLIPGAANYLMATIGHYFPRLAEFGMYKAIFEKLPAKIER